MASTELDPLFVKGLRLLHSKSKDSTDQLKQLLDDVIAQSKQGMHPKDRLYTSIKVEGESKLHIIKKSSRETAEISNLSSKYSAEESIERKPEKRRLEKFAMQDLAETEAKIPKLEPPISQYSYYPSSPDLPKLDQYSKKEDDTDSSEENADADDFAMEMGLACVICKQLDVTQGNQLIECQECHNLYHQECHRPPATDYDVNDPRSVWYCAKCLKNMKKMATKTQKPVKSSSTVSAKEPASTAKSTRSESAPSATVLPFKRSELKPTISSQANTSQSSTNKPIGLAGLAANFGGGRIATSSSSTSVAPATRGSKTTTSTLNQKPAPSTLSTSTKSSLVSTSSSLMSLSKTTSSSSAAASSSTPTTVATASGQKPAVTSSSPMKGLGLLSAAVAASASTRSAATSAQAAIAAAAGGNGNSGHKPPSCSPLMTADKRLQIMKKKASKMQERRRLSNK